jgi:hypothetical protein
MMNRLREWGVPVGFILLWAIAAAFTLRALIGMESTLQAAQVPPQSTQVADRPVVAHVQHTSPAS